MTAIRFVDTVPLSGVNFTDEGYLEAEAFTVRTGIQMYGSKELQLDGAWRLVPIYRPPEEVFDKESVASFARKPVTLDHPPVLVTTDNWAQYAVGDVDSEIMRDGERLRMGITLRRKDAVQKVRDGVMRQLSAGYTCDIDWTAGVTPQGEPYEGVQRNIRGNHVAIVETGRAGKEFRIGDAAGAENWGAAPITVGDIKEDSMSNALKTVVLGDTAVNVPVADAAIIDAWKLAQTKAMNDAQAKFDKDMATKDAELVKAKEDLAEAQKKIPTGDTLSKMVADRAALLDTAKKLSPKLDLTKLSDADIRKAVVVDRRGAEMKDKSDVYIDAAFDILVADHKPATTDGVHTEMTRLAKDTGQPVLDHNAQYRKDIAEMWKTPAKQEA